MLLANEKQGTILINDFRRKKKINFEKKRSRPGQCAKVDSPSVGEHIDFFFFEFKVISSRAISFLLIIKSFFFGYNS